MPRPGSPSAASSIWHTTRGSHSASRCGRWHWTHLPACGRLYSRRRFVIGCSIIFLEGHIDRADLAINAPLDVLIDPKKHLADDALSIGLAGHEVVLRPLPTLPAVRDAAIDVHITGRTAKVAVKQAKVQLPSGRKLSIPNGVFRNRQYGSGAAAIANADQYRRVAPRSRRTADDGAAAQYRDELLDRSGNEPRQRHGPDYARGAGDEESSGRNNDLFRAGGILKIRCRPYGHGSSRGSRRVASLCRNGDFRVKGDVKIAGLPASVEVHQRAGAPGSDVTLQTVLDACKPS